ncbi:hypothetical protein L6164_024987 [Bauhinia variegata]|uniref:Uncharacterized protein n=1 Tax=Bauhinia variegata TaxID=167791 RepID=A0ACB9LZI3_BAUVA|nr:hypothetical protein L6164_024987 [Bauhinia variegata]
MPVSDPNSGRAFIWIVSCLLFFCILAGGGCLGAYMILPESQGTTWLSEVGVTLVCLPWAFWLLTFLYRIFSRVTGYRFNVGNPNGGGGGGVGRGGGGGTGNLKKASGAGAGAVDMEASEAKGEAANVVEDKKVQEHRHSTSSNSSSVASHESEMPLKISMAS